MKDEEEEEELLQVKKDGTNQTDDLALLLAWSSVLEHRKEKRNVLAHVRNVYSMGVEIIDHWIDTNMISNSMQISIDRTQFTLYLFAVEG